MQSTAVSVRPQLSTSTSSKQKLELVEFKGALWHFWTKLRSALNMITHDLPNVSLKKEKKEKEEQVLQWILQGEIAKYLCKQQDFDLLLLLLMHNKLYFTVSKSRGLYRKKIILSACVLTAWPSDIICYLLFLCRAFFFYWVFSFFLRPNVLKNCLWQIAQY